MNIPKPTAAEQGDADYGTAPTGYRDAIGQYFLATLKDPSSIQYGDMTSPTKGFFQNRAPLITGGKVSTVYGWIVNTSINAKNSYGGYVGFKPYSFLFRGEQIVHIDIPDAE